MMKEEEEILESQKKFNENTEAFEKNQELLDQIARIVKVLGGNNNA